MLDPDLALRGRLHVKGSNSHDEVAGYELPLATEGSGSSFADQLASAWQECADGLHVFAVLLLLLLLLVLLSFLVAFNLPCPGMRDVQGRPSYELAACDGVQLQHARQAIDLLIRLRRSTSLQHARQAIYTRIRPRRSTSLVIQLQHARQAIDMNTRIRLRRSTPLVIRLRRSTSLGHVLHGLIWTWRALLAWTESAKPKQLRNGTYLHQPSNFAMLFCWAFWLLTT